MIPALASCGHFANQLKWFNRESNSAKSTGKPVSKTHVIFAHILTQHKIFQLPLYPAKHNQMSKLISSCTTLLFFSKPH